MSSGLKRLSGNTTRVREGRKQDEDGQEEEEEEEEEEEVTYRPEGW